ncbi:MAG: hypothetical protein ACSHWZ_03080 [Sulfitobacter sp.]
MKQAVFAALIALASAGSVAAEELGGCAQIGPGAGFCGADLFKPLRQYDLPGQSFWLHRAGFLSKLLVQDDPAGRANQGEVEAQIIGMVRGRAGEMGAGFEFLDVVSARAGGQPYGTLSYRVKDGGRAKTILHSYLVADGVVVQVISQIGVSRASREATALSAAHEDALRALRLSRNDPKA